MTNAAAPAWSATNELTEVLMALRLSPPIEVGDLTFVSLLAGRHGPAADLLEDGLPRGRTVITEVSEAGRVDRIRVRHAGPRPLLLLDGEEIVGAKQNRMLNATFLVATGTQVDLPVSCVERGRWRSESESFRTTSRTATSNIRSTKLHRVAQSLATAGTYDADQRAVWSGVATFLGRTRSTSATASLSDGVSAREPDIESRLGQLARLAPEADQIGLAALRGGKLLSIDLFGGTDLYRRCWRKIAKGLFAEVFADSVSRCTDSSQVVQAALDTAAGAPLERTQPPGMGHTLRIISRHISGLALAHGGQLFHAMIAPAGSA
jgi:hypothetical protein